MAKAKQIRISAADQQVKERNTRAYFNLVVKDHQRKEAQKDSPCGPWRGDTEFGQLLGIKSTTQNLLGYDHPLSIYMGQIIDAICQDKEVTLS